MWVIYALISAFCLGFYDISKKQALKTLDVIPVLLLSCGLNALLLTPMLATMPDVTWHQHMLILAKAALVLVNWWFIYTALKHLPITLVAPINATRPMWTLIGALLIFGEQLNGWQAVGIGVALISFFGFSLVGKKEGISFSAKSSKWLWLLIIGTLLGACSGLYDKYLMQRIDVQPVQYFYSLEQFLLMLPVYLCTRNQEPGTKTPEEYGNVWFRWMAFKRQKKLRANAWVIGISVFLVLSDYVYLKALQCDGAMISVISTLRRSSVLIAFAYGAIVMKEKNIGWKVVCLSGVVAGMVFLLVGSL